MTVICYCLTLELIFVALEGMHHLRDTTLDHDPRSIIFQSYHCVG